MAEMLSRIRKGNVQLRKVEPEKPKPAEQGIMQEMASILVGREGLGREGPGGRGQGEEPGKCFRPLSLGVP